MSHWRRVAAVAFRAEGRGLTDSEHRFRPGQRVRVTLTSEHGNPRTPAYVKGHVGVIVSLHGRIPNPTDHRGIYPPLCTVAFEVAELFGSSRNERLYVDVHEDWLDSTG